MEQGGFTMIRRSAMRGEMNVLVLGQDSELDFISRVLIRFLQKEGLEDQLGSVTKTDDPRYMDTNYDKGKSWGIRDFLELYDLILVGESLIDRIPMESLRDSRVLVISRDIPAKYVNNVKYILIDDSPKKNDKVVLAATNMSKVFRASIGVNDEGEEVTDEDLEVS
jgi:hypothetical protein